MVKTNNKGQENKLLSGLLQKQASNFTQSFTASHSFDKRLYEEDILVSRAHVKMLYSIGMLNQKEFRVLDKGLKETASYIAKGNMSWKDELEDIHMHIESHLTKKIGDTGKKLHLGRSRNDQIATDVRLYIRKGIDELALLMNELRKELATKALEEYATLMPGFTHLQPAQPVTCGHHLMAWHEMLLRDYERMQDCRKRVNMMPLGSAALAGTSFPIDRNMLAKELGFDEVMANSLDAVSSRDFIIEFIAAAAITMQHLSRWAEELIIWCTAQFGFVELADELCTGSSIMPQKKNPDLPELIRGKSGRVFGNLISILTIMKGQTLAYNKDNQEDKEALFDTMDTLKNCIIAWKLLIRGMTFNHQNMEKSLELGYVNATRLADYLTKKDIPFRTAYSMAGKLVALAQKHKYKRGLQDIPIAQMQLVSSVIEDDIYKLLDLTQIVASYNHFGGSAPNRVKKAANIAIRKAEKDMIKIEKLKG